MKTSLANQAQQHVPVVEEQHGSAQSSTEEPAYIDVRTPHEFESVHIPDARNIPLPSLEPVVEDLRQLSRRNSLVLVCRTQNRAKMAHELLSRHGITNCSVLEGGMNRWIEENKPVIRGRNRLSLEGQVRAIAGAIILVGIGLTLAVHPGFLLIPALVGAGLLHAGLTDSCLMGMLLAKLPYNRNKT
jgi:rhodanese-related sulfurtransferase